MKGLVIYSPQQPAISQFAETIYDTLIIDKELMTVDEAPEELQGYDIIFAGFWMEDGKTTADSEAFLQKMEDCNVALFSAMKEDPTTDEAREWLRHNRDLLPDNNMFLGAFICQTKSDEHDVERPGKEDLYGAQVFAREMFYSLH